MVAMFVRTTIVSVLALGAAAGQAATVVPVSATGSTSYPGYADSNAIDQGTGSDVSDWASFGEGASSTLRLDLGAVYKLTTAFVTDRVTSGGANNGFVGGLYDYTTRYSLTAYTDASFTTIIGSPVIVSKPAPGTHGSPSDFLSTAALGGVKAEFLQYNVLASDGLNPGLSDIHFNGSVVPEPATWMLMLAGFGMIGVSTRRRIARLAA